MRSKENAVKVVALLETVCKHCTQRRFQFIISLNIAQNKLLDIVLRVVVVSCFCHQR